LAEHISSCLLKEVCVWGGIAKLNFIVKVAKKKQRTQDKSSLK